MLFLQKIHTINFLDCLGNGRFLCYISLIVMFEADVHSHISIINKKYIKLCLFQLK